MADKIAVMVDSCSDVPDAFRANHDIFMVPMTINYNDKSYLDRVNISPQEVYDQLKVEIPTTATPTGKMVLQTFERIQAAGYDAVICVCISSGLSGTYQQIRLIADTLDLKVAVIDTKNIGIGSGFSAILAAQMVTAGFHFEAIVANIEKVAAQTHVYVYVPTLEYLQKGGRIGKVAGLVGNVLHLKPIITCDSNGVFDTVAKVRGEKRSLRKLFDIVESQTQKYHHFNLAVADGANAAIADQTAEKLHQLYPQASHLFEGDISPALGVHTGPGLIAVGIQPLDEALL